MEEVKKRSSKWIKTKGEAFRGFQWQAGYGAFSIGASKLATVTAYIERQEERHRGESFRDELLGFLKAYHVAYDERYLWD